MEKCKCGGSVVRSADLSMAATTSLCLLCGRRTVNGVVVEPGTIRRPDAPAIKR